MKKQLVILNSEDYPNTDTGRFMQWLDATIASGNGNDVLCELPHKSILCLNSEN